MAIKIEDKKFDDSGFRRSDTLDAIDNLKVGQSFTTTKTHRATVYLANR